MSELVAKPIAVAEAVGFAELYLPHEIRLSRFGTVG
jgi:hypothetical protein